MFDTQTQQMKIKCHQCDKKSTYTQDIDTPKSELFNPSVLTARKLTSSLPILMLNVTSVSLTEYVNVVRNSSRIMIIIVPIAGLLSSCD